MLVEKSSMMVEGAEVSSGTCVVGNPAYAQSKSEQHAASIHQHRPSSCHFWMFGFLKVLWIVLELYVFFVIALLSQWLWMPYLPAWQYSAVLKWFLLIAWFHVTSIITGVIIKWMLIRKRSPGLFNDTLCREMANWAADWHF